MPLPASAEPADIENSHTICGIFAIECEICHVRAKGNHIVVQHRGTNLIDSGSFCEKHCPICNP